MRPTEDEEAPNAAPISVRLLDYDRDATRRLSAALLFRRGGDYGHALALSQAMTETERIEMIDGAVRDIGPHDAPPREFELVATPSSSSSTTAPCGNFVAIGCRLTLDSH